MLEEKEYRVNDIEVRADEVGVEDVSIDSDEQEFLDNVSWDTSSDEDDIELDNRIMDEALPDQAKLSYAQQEAQMRNFEDNYDLAFHEYKKKYMAEPYQHGQSRSRHQNNHKHSMTCQSLKSTAKSSGGYGGSKDELALPGRKPTKNGDKSKATKSKG